MNLNRKISEEHNKEKSKKTAIGLIILSFIAIFLIALTAYLIYYASGYRVDSEVFLVSELTGEDLTPLIEDTDIFVTKTPSSPDSNYSTYSFNIKDQIGNIKKIEVDEGLGVNIFKGVYIELPQPVVQYYESNSVEPSIKIESVYVYHYGNYKGKEFMYTIFMPK